MFLRRTRGLIDFLVAALCLWAAAYHTPIGAGLRHAVSRALGVRSSARPLLAYYSGGVYDAQEVRVPSRRPLPLLSRRDFDPEMALGYGLFATVGELPARRRQAALALAVRYGFEPRELEDSERGPDETGRLLRAAARELGSEEAAVLAVFSGFEPARYASERVRTEGAPPVLENLIRHLPPGFDDEISHASHSMMLGTAYALAWPVPEWAPVTSPFGMRVHPTLGTRKLHTGVDLGVPEGTEVRSVAAGVVRRASEDAVNGRVLVIDHGRGVSTAYCHNSRLLVRAGEVVRRGELIAQSGNTGRSTGPHLHYQLELGNAPTDPFHFRSPPDPSVLAGRRPPELIVKVISERRLEVQGRNFPARAMISTEVNPAPRGCLKELARKVEADATGSFAFSLTPSKRSACAFACEGSLSVIASTPSGRAVRSEPVPCWSRVTAARGATPARAAGAP